MWGRWAFYNLLIKSQPFCAIVYLGCDLHVFLQGQPITPFLDAVFITCFSEALNCADYFLPFGEREKLELKKLHSSRWDKTPGSLLPREQIFVMQNTLEESLSDYSLATLARALRGFNRPSPWIPGGRTHKSMGDPPRTLCPKSWKHFPKQLKALCKKMYLNHWIYCWYLILNKWSILLL